MDYLMKDFGKILKKNALMMRRLLLQENTDCMRVYDRNFDELPLSVDLYGKYARITDYSAEGLSIKTEELVKDIVRRMCYIQSEFVIFHRREKRSSGEQHELQSNKSISIEVSEASHRFKVDLTKRIDTGLFLDHYKTRKFVESISDNSKVLNLFSYTGSFSVYAAAGNATLVESVDLSKTYSEWAKNNLLLNGFEGDKYPCITEDALKYIIESLNAKKSYDLVIFDPPSFSNSRKMEKDFDVQRDYVRYLRLINNLLTKEGRVIFSTNLSSFHMDPGRIQGFKVTNITHDILADGFSKKKGTSRTWILEKISKVKLTKEDYQGKKYFTVKETQKRKRVNEMDEIQKSEEKDFEEMNLNVENQNDLLSASQNENEFDEIIEALEQKNDLNKETEDSIEDDSNENIVEEENDFEKIIANLEKDSEVEEIEETKEYDSDDDLVLVWDEGLDNKPKERASRPSNNYNDRNNSNRSYGSRDRGDNRSFRNDRPSSFSRDDRDRRPSRDEGDRRPARFNGERSFNRDDRDRRPSRDGGDRGSSRFNGERSFNRDDRDRRPSRDGGDRGPSRFNGERSFNRDDRDRRPSRDGGDRGSSRFNGERSFNRDDRDRRPSRDGGDRGPSRFNGERSFNRDDRDRRPSRDGGDRGPSRFNGERSFNRDDRDRRPSRDGGDRGPSRFNGERSFNRDDRDRRPSRDGGDRGPSRFNGERSFNRDDRDRRPSRDDRDRNFSSGDKERRYSRDSRDGSSSRGEGERRYSRDDRERKYTNNNFSKSENPSSDRSRVKSSKPKPYGFEKKNKSRDDNDF